MSIPSIFVLYINIIINSNVISIILLGSYYLFDFEAFNFNPGNRWSVIITCTWVFY